MPIAKYECSAFFRNPIPQIASKPYLKKIMADRIDILAEILGFDRRTIIGLGYSQAILAGVWCLDMKSDDWSVFWLVLKCSMILIVLIFGKIIFQYINDLRKTRVTLRFTQATGWLVSVCSAAK